jgi:hypothetical protein
VAVKDRSRGAPGERRDRYWQSLTVTMVFWWGTAALLAWLASRWPARFAAGVVLFFLLIYGKLSFLFRPLRRLFGGKSP